MNPVEWDDVKAGDMVEVEFKSVHGWQKVVETGSKWMVVSPTGWSVHRDWHANDVRLIGHRKVEAPKCEWCDRADRPCWLHGGVRKAGEEVAWWG